MTTAAFSKQTIVPAQVRKRNPIVLGARETHPSIILSVMATAPAQIPSTVNNESFNRQVLDTPYNVLEVYVGSSVDLGIAKGDTLIILGEEHAIRHVEPWRFKPPLEYRYRLVYERDDR